MKKMLMLTLTLALALSATAVFAGLTRSPSGNHDEFATLDNKTQSNRTFNITVICGDESVSDSFLIRPNEPESAFYQGKEAEMPQQWSVVVTDDSGAQISSATFSYDGTNFQPGQIGDGLTFEATSDNSMTLTATK